jgi:hypothetical protein
MLYSDLADLVREAAKNDPRFQKEPEVGANACGPCGGIWVQDILCDYDNDGDWGAVVCGKDGKSLRVQFTVAADGGSVTLGAPAVLVERKTSYVPVVGGGEKVALAYASEGGFDAGKVVASWVEQGGEVKAVELDAAETVRATWSEAARKASADARKTHNLADEDSWNTFGPGTGAYDQEANSFQKEVPGGHLRGDTVQYNINPLSRRKGFALSSAGHPDSAGLWKDHGVFNTHRQAMKAAHEHYHTTVTEKGSAGSMAQASAVASPATVHSATPALPPSLASVGAASKGVIESLSARRQKAEQVMASVMPVKVKLPPKKPATGLEVLEVLAYERDHPAKKNLPLTR